MLFRKRFLKNSNFSDFRSNVGNDAVRAFGIGSVMWFFSDTKSVLATAGRSFDAG